MSLALAVAVLVIGGVLFFVGIAGQFRLGKRRRQGVAHTQDRAGARIVLTLGSIVIGLWLIIASAAGILHANSHRTPANPGGGDPSAAH